MGSRVVTRTLLFGSKFMFKKIKKCVLPKRKRKRDDRDEFPIPSGNGDLEATTSEPPKKKSKKRRCAVCKKKLTLAEGVDCRCGMLLCGIHRYTDKHECEFDFKSEDRKILEKNNQKCVDDKVIRI